MRKTDILRTHACPEFLAVLISVYRNGETSCIDNWLSFRVRLLFNCRNYAQYPDYTCSILVN